MGTQGAGRKRSTNKDKSTAEDDALNLIAREAEARLAAKRAARAEAREIRMKELERQQKEIFQVQKKYYGLNPREPQADSKWGDIEQWMEDTERFSRSSLLHTLSDDDERMSVGSRGSVRSDLDSVGAYGGRGSSLPRKSKKKKKHKHRDRNGCHDDYSALSSRSSFTSSDLLDLSGLSRNPSLSFNGYQNILYDDGLSLCSGSRRVSSCHPVASSYRSSRASSRAGSARTSPVVEDRDFDKGPAPSLASVGGASSRRGSAESALTADGSVREIKEIHELKDQIQDVEAKYQQNLKEAKEALVEAEDKYRKAMVSNAQLDNEKNNLMYQVDTLRDALLELEELLSESRRQNQDRLKELERQKQAHIVLQFQFGEMKETLKQSEELLNELRQLRLQQDGLVREISDLQETVEWKDKKLGALERQKDYSDAVRLERDELRREAVRLRDVLKKHGIVLGAERSDSGDAAAPDGAEPPGQAAPADGNGILGGSDQLRACRDEVAAPEQQEETLEDVKQNRWSCDGQTADAQSSEDPDGQTSGDPIHRPHPEAVIVVSRDLQQIQTSGETETCEVDSLSHPGLTATEAPGLSGGQGSKQEVVTAEPSAKQAGLNSDPQQEPEEAENESQAQVSTAKKKKRKKKSKKKGGTQENKDQQKAGTEKQNEKPRKDPGVQSNGLTAELESSRSTAGPQDNQEPEKVKDLDPSENVSTKENLQEPNMDPGSEGHNQEKHTNTRMSEGADVLGSTQASRLGLEIVKDPQNEEDPEKPDEGSAGGILKESEVPGPDEEGNHITCKSKDGPDSSEDEATGEATGEAAGEATGEATGEDASGLQQPTTDQVSGDEGKTGNTETLEHSDAVGSSCPIGPRAELPEDQQNQETSPTARDTAEPPEGFLQGEARETDLASNEGDEGPNQHLPSWDQTAAIPGFQEPDSDQVSGDQEEEAVESPEAPDEELVLQNQEETSEPEKHELVLQTTETSQTETLKGPNESETAEDVEETEPETGSDGGSNILTPGKREDPGPNPEVQTQVGPNPEQVGPNPEQVGPNPEVQTQVGPNPEQVGPNPEQVGPNPEVQTQVGPNPEQVGPNPEQVGPNPEQVGPNPEQVKESMEEPEGDDSHVQLDSDGDDGEEDEGQSFDFDDSDVEAAAESALSNKLDLEDVETAAEVIRTSSELWQRNTEMKTDDGEETVPQGDDGDKTPEEAEDAPETLEQKTSPTAEDGLDPLDPHETPGQTAKQEPQAGKDPKKKKGKGKSKEDCKMS